MFGAWATRALIALVVSFTFTAATGCAPRVRIDAPKDPIVINLNIKIDHELRVKVEDDIDDLFDDNAAIFGSAAADGAEAGSAEGAAKR